MIPPHAFHIKKHKRNTVKTVSRCVCVELGAWWPLSRWLTLTSPRRRPGCAPRLRFSVRHFFLLLISETSCPAVYIHSWISLLSSIFYFYSCRRNAILLWEHTSQLLGEFICYEFKLSKKKIDVHDLGVYWCGYDGTVFGNLYIVSFYYFGKYRDFEVETIYRSWLKTLAETIVV